nr:RNA-directed DNA polymerase, eukaryota [Tanacetum cinerariifolium]
MGDFNEARHKSDRFGLIFNGQGVDEFSSFIANAGLEEVPLGGSAFTWCHKSATKMSKLDRFLISENLFITYPHITATTLERYLSDHRPILLRETYNDYGPILEWIKSNRHSRTGMKEKYKEEIRTLDDDTDNAQKTKIKCSVEGDENFRYFHGMLNKKRNRFDKPMEHRAVLDMCYPRSLLIDQQENLERMVTKEEAVSHFFTQADIPKGCNPSFISLIMKIPDANKVNDFRPISLVGIIYKIIAKILANRLVRVLGDIVNERVVDACLFMGIKLSHLVNLSHMFYADDVVFVGQWSDNNINTLIHVLDCFYRASGLRMNMSSKVGGSMSRVKAWKEVIDKVKSRLSKWKIKALSISGRQFFNGHEVGSNKATWIKWNSVLTAKDRRGLGVSSLYALNKGLMMKWVWRSMGKAKYAGARTCWTTIVNEIRILSDQGVNVLEFTRLKLENGKSVNVCTKLSDPSMDYSFRRKTRGGAKHEQLDALMDLVSTVNLVSMGDRWVWTLESSGEFSMASLWKVIDEKRLLSVCSKTRWFKYVPINVNVLSWKIKMDVLPCGLIFLGEVLIFIPFRALFVIVG